METTNGTQKYKLNADKSRRTVKQSIAVIALQGTLKEKYSI